MDKKIKPLRLGDLLVQVGKLTDEQLYYALEIQKEKELNWVKYFRTLILLPIRK